MTHLSLRPFTHGDAEAILGSAPRPAEWADDYPSAPDVEIAGLLASGTFALATPAEPWGPWVVLLPDGTPVGGCGFHGPPVDGVAEIGYHVSPSHQGRGLATSAVGLLIVMAATHGVRTLVAETDHDNIASQGVLARSGFDRGVDVDASIRWSRAVDAPSG
ncbi:MAG: hypothetical protein QG661_2623 [Actinomycetota bacterium]|nr:hypothetical protein [Actinomycetota bacterium]